MRTWGSLMLSQLLLVRLGFLRIGVEGTGEYYVRNHSFVFVTGWPQSGTSLIQQFLTTSAEVSTMTQNCEELLGKRCVNWNHEGQWLLRGTTRQFFNSGAMCPLSKPLTDSQRNTVMDEWKQFWDLDKPYLSEKSPQSMLKTDILRQLTHDAVKTKILIVLKNPVTLNIATPRNSGWAYYLTDPSLNTTSNVKSSNSRAMNWKPMEPSKIKISIEQMITNAKHFIHFMTHDNSNRSGAECSLGWLPAVELLQRQLASDTNSTRNVRIIRYEQFERPNALCKQIFEFIFDSRVTAEFNQTAEKVCDAHFRNSTTSGKTVTSSTISTSTRTVGNSQRVTVLHPQYNRIKQPQLRINSNRGKSCRQLATAEGNSDINNRSVEKSVDFGTAQNQRQLRLRNYQSAQSFTFVPELVTTSGRERMLEFLRSYRKLPKNLQKELDDIDKRLRPLGYSIKDWSFMDTVRTGAVDGRGDSSGGNTASGVVSLSPWGIQGLNVKIDT